MGHANISITHDRYGHLMPGNEAEAAGLLDVYHARASERDEEAARAAVVWERARSRDWCFSIQPTAARGGAPEMLDVNRSS